MDSGVKDSAGPARGEPPPGRSTGGVWVLLAAIGVLGVLLALTRRRHDVVVAEYVEFRRTATNALRQDLMGRDSALQVGDLLPELEVVDSEGGISTLRTLATGGIRYFYLYGRECPLCLELAPALEELRGTALDSFARISYQNGEDKVPEGGGRLSFGAKGKTASSRFPITRTVPSLIVVRGDGRVVAVADGLGDVRRHLSLFTLVPEERLTIVTGSSTPLVPPTE